MPGALPLWLPGGSSYMASLKGDPDFQKLSPQSQATIAKYMPVGNGDPKAFAQAMKDDPALASAMAEAKQVGALSHPITTGMKFLMAAVSIPIGAAALGAAGIGPLAAASGGTPAATVGAAGPLAADEAFTAGPIAGAGIEGGTAAAAPIVASAGGGSLLHSLLPSIIGAGSNIAGTAMASHANTEAAKIAAAEADKALAIQQQQYALQRQDTAPYRALGQGAVNNLGYLGGIDTTSNLTPLSSTVPTTLPPPLPTPSGAPGSAPTAGPPTAPLNPPTMAQQMSGSGNVRIQDPSTGLVHLIPQSQAQAAQQAGGRLV